MSAGGYRRVGDDAAASDCGAYDDACGDQGYVLDDVSAFKGGQVGEVDPALSVEDDERGEGAEHLQEEQGYGEAEIARSEHAEADDAL